MAPVKSDGGLTMADLPEEPTPRPRPRPGPRVAGRRQRVAPRGADQEQSPSDKASSAERAPDAAPMPKRPSPPRTAATRAAAVQAAAAKAAAARRTASKAVATPTASKPAAKRPGSKAAAGKIATPAGRGAATTATGSKKPALASTARRTRLRAARKQRVNLTLVVLSVLTVLAAAAVTLLIVERATTPPHLDPELLPAAKDAYAAMYSFDYTDPDGSVANSLDVLTGELRARFEQDLNGQVVESYLEVSATTRVDNITVGLQSINDQQTEAVVVAYGTFVVKSVNSGQQDSPEGSECAVTNDGADACVQTLQLNLELVDGTWLVSNVTTLTEG